jgi:hypothetical protein
MKKLIGLIRTKEREEKFPAIEKKANAKEDKVQQLSDSRELTKERPLELFWDGYSDIGYC